MKNLFFKQKYVDLIKQNKKNQTVRLKNILKVNDLFTVNFKDLICKVLQITEKQVKEISETEAKQDGFTSTNELKEVLFDLYKINDNTNVYIIKFEKMISANCFFVY